MFKVKSVITNNYNENLQKIYRKIRTEFSDFNNKILHEIIFGKTSKKFVKVQVSTIRLKDCSSTWNQGIEKKKKKKKKNNRI